MPLDPSDTIAMVERLNQEIQELKEKQIAALKTATYTGMTPEQAKDYDALRKQITELINRMIRLQQSHRANQQ